MGKRGHLPLWKCCKVFLCISDYSTNYLCIIFTTCRQLLGTLPQTPTIPGPRWGTFVPRPLICPPLKKIMQAPMTPSRARAVFTRARRAETEWVRERGNAEGEEICLEAWLVEDYISSLEYIQKRNREQTGRTNLSRVQAGVQNGALLLVPRHVTVCILATWHHTITSSQAPPTDTADNVICRS